MPKSIIKLNTKYIETFRTAKVAGMFDVTVGEKLERQWTVDIPCENKEWHIGVIVGPSGSGKTTIGRELFGRDNYHTGFSWPNDSSFLDGFDSALDVNDITQILSHVGFSSPPSWLLPFSCLSNGQKFRTEMARIISEKNQLTVIDEFTSVVDRQVAKIGCAAISKAIRKRDKKIVALSCHYDILEWLEPDWIYDVASDVFSWGSLRRPGIELEIFQCNRKAWQLFKGHHYLSASISNNAECFIALYNSVPVGFTCAIHFMSNLKRVRRGHRTVVLPDYQGVGIGNTLSEVMAQYYIDNDYRFYSLTSHPAMIQHRNRSSKWRMLRRPGNCSSPGKKDGKSFRNSSAASRLSASFEYIGDRSN